MNAPKIIFQQSGRQIALIEFVVRAILKGCEVRESAISATEAFAKAVDWRLENLGGVQISDGVRCYSILGFVSAFAGAEIAEIVRGTTGRSISSSQF